MCGGVGGWGGDLVRPGDVVEERDHPREVVVHGWLATPVQDGNGDSSDSGARRRGAGWLVYRDGGGSGTGWEAGRQLPAATVPGESCYLRKCRGGTERKGARNEADEESAKEQRSAAGCARTGHVLEVGVGRWR